MKIKILLVALICIYSITGIWAQTENKQTEKITGVWVLDSLYVGEIAKDKTETTVDSASIKDIVSFIFTRLDLQKNNVCKLSKARLTNLPGSYTLMKDTLQLHCEGNVFSYQYKLSEYLILEGVFSGGTPEGLLANYRVFMRLKK
jgi:hypothetical protein